MTKPVTMRRVLVLIGQIGSGKTSAARILCQSGRVELLDVCELQHESGGLDASRIAKAARSRNAESLILECSGAATDFEYLVRMLEDYAKVCVVRLMCSIEVGARRKLDGRFLSPPLSGGSWGPQLIRTEARLRAVPADATIDTNNMEPIQVAKRVAAEWERNRQPLLSQCDVYPISFSGLSTWERCALAYRFKYMDCRVADSESEPLQMGIAVHDTLAWLYSKEGPTSPEEMLRVLRNRLGKAMTRIRPSQAVMNQAESALRFHLQSCVGEDRETTLATESDFTLEIGSGQRYTGRMDRVSETQDGTIAVTDFKFSDGRYFYGSNVPDMLQLEAYGLAAMLKYLVPTVEVRRHLIGTCAETIRHLTEQDAERVKFAIERWARRLRQDREFVPSPGKLCGWCEYRQGCPHRALVGALPI